MTTEPTKPKPKRRWWQYSLRTFFVLLTVLCVWLGWMAHRANEQRKAVAAIIELGGTVYYDYQLDHSRNPINDAEPPGWKWMVQLVGVDYLHNAVAVEISVLSPLEAPLRQLPALKKLELFSTQVSDVTPLVGLKNLEGLLLHDTRVSDLTPLAGLKNLRWLWLSHTQVSKEQVDKLRQALPDCTMIWSPQSSAP